MLTDYRGIIADWARCLAEDTMVAAKSADGFDINGVDACRQLPFRLIAMALYKDMLSEDVRVSCLQFLYQSSR